MEKQKVFWVVLTVSVFVVVVLVAGVLLLRQQPTTAPRTTVSPMNGTGTQLYEYQREAPQTPPASGPQAETPPASDQQTMHFYVGEGAKPGTSTTAGGTPSPGSPPAPGTPAPSVGSPPPAAPAPAPSSASARAKPQQALKTPGVKSTLQARVPRKTAGYWIQTGSYKSQTKAEELVSLLESKGLGSRVFSWTSKNETFYRVRVGPYSNKGEADKFLALVKQVQGLETSFVSLVPAARTAVN